jgi:tetratricopeptide (TPR) repeat protein
VLLLGELLRRAGELEEARAVLEMGKNLAPSDPALAFNLGGIYRAFGQIQSARREFQLVLEQQPQHSAAREALVLIEIAECDYGAAGAIADAAPGSTAARSELFELICVEAIARGDFDIALIYGRSAFERLANVSTAMTLARAEYHARDDASAKRRLHWILAQRDAAPELRARAMGTLADIADRCGDFQHAYQQYAASKHELKGAYERSGAGRPGSFHELVERLAESVAQTPDPPLRAAQYAPKDVAGHVFLLGFPRTGTTLIEQCLAGHPDVVTSDEIDALRSAIAPYLNEPNPFAAFGAARDADHDMMRRMYWGHVGRRTPSLTNKIFIDKMPFNSVYAGFIPPLFPTARIIFAIRSPLDVVFSCFRRRFGMNSATYEFCTLEGSVRLYCAVMRLFELTRSKLSSSLTECRYEDVVRDLRGTLTRLCGFIGVEWREDMMRFSERARRRPLSTVSAPQLAQGLYDGGESWRGYKEFLTPHVPDLAPWLSRFGYALD